MTKSPTWAARLCGQLSEIKTLDVPYMLDKLAEMQEFIDHTRQKLESMQQRQAAIERHLEDLEDAT
jgi:uncharacterized membrane protein